MNILIFIPALLVFIYCLYKQVKDDYFFIRKNISSEQMFDIAFIVLWVSLFFSRLFSIAFHPIADTGILLSFFSMQISDFSFLGMLVGGVGGLYFVGKYKKLPIGRLFDFFVTAFVVALPVGFLSLMVFLREYVLLFYFFNTAVYSLFAYIFIKYFKSKSTIFFLIFPFMFLISSLISQFLNKSNFVNVENLLLVLITIIGSIFYFKSK